MKNYIVGILLTCPIGFVSALRTRNNSQVDVLIVECDRCGSLALVQFLICRTI